MNLKVVMMHGIVEIKDVVQFGESKSNPNVLDVYDADGIVASFNGWMTVYRDDADVTLVGIRTSS